MPINKDHKTSDPRSSMSGSLEREFESQGKNKRPGVGDQKAGSHKGTMSDSGIEGCETNTAGGRKGNFSDKDRGSEDQWSPGSTGASDQ